VSQPVRFTRGDAFDLPFIVYERLATGAEVQEDIPRRDITDDVIRYTAKRNEGQADDAPGVIRKDGDVPGEIVKTAPLQGEAVIRHVPADTKSLPNRLMYLYTDVEVNTEDGSTPQTVIADVLIMVPERTIRTAPI
jgi:hypothetical protein